MNKEKDDKSFVNDLIKEFPEIRQDVLDEDYIGLISLQIGVFRKFTQDAINKNNLDLVTKCFQFIEKNFDVVNSDIRNSLYISYLGKLEIANNKIKKMLPAKLKSAKEEIDIYYKSTSENDKLNKFLKDL
jgi:hypothetical protein